MHSSGKCNTVNINVSYFFCFPQNGNGLIKCFGIRPGLCWEANMLKSRHSVIISSHCTTIYNLGKHKTFHTKTLIDFLSLNEFHFNKRI